MSLKLLRNAEKFMYSVLNLGGRVAFELPSDNELWSDPQLQKFEKEDCLARVHFHGCAFNLRGRQGGLIKKPWTISTSDLRLIQYLDQYRCSGQHEHEHAMGGNISKTAFYTREMAKTIVESLYPKKFFYHVPSMTSSALVTKSLKKSEWSINPEVLAAVKKEAEELRKNNTWDDHSVTTLSNLKYQSKVSRNKVKIANLLTLCGVKHWEQDISCLKYKGRIVYRGDDIRDAEGTQVVFDPIETSTNPTALIALNLILFFGIMKGNTLSLADAVQAFLQAPLLEETWVVLGEELWLPHWFDIYPKGIHLRVLTSNGRQIMAIYLDEYFLAINAIQLESFPSNYLIQRGSKMLLLNVYVDNLTLSGDSSLHRQFWEELHKHINIEPEVYISQEGSRILGRNHIAKHQSLQSQMIFDMRPYAQQTVEHYCEICDIEVKSLKNVNSPALPESSMTDDKSLLMTGTRCSEWSCLSSVDALVMVIKA